MGTIKRFVFVVILGILVGCGQQRQVAQTTAQAPVAPLQPTTIRTTVQPTAAPTATRQSATATPAQVTLGTYRDPRGVFSMDVPSNWKTTPLENGVGFTSLAYNANVIVTISFAWQSEPLDPDQQVQLVEQIKARTFAAYLAKDVVLNSARDGARYSLDGSATLNGTPTHVEFTLDQTAGGTIYLQSWLVPNELWNDFQTTFKQPMQASLVVDDGAAKAVAQR